jgi:cytochrome P450
LFCTNDVERGTTSYLPLTKTTRLCPRSSSVSDENGIVAYPMIASTTCITLVAEQYRVCSLALIVTLLLYCLLPAVVRKLRFPTFPGPFPFLITPVPGPHALLALVQRHGEVFHFYTSPKRRIVVVCNPVDARFVTTRNFSKAEDFTGPLRAFFAGESLLIARQGNHAMQRRSIVKNGFNFQFLDAVAAHAQSEMTRFSVNLDSTFGKIVDVSDVILRLMRSIMGKVTVGKSLDAFAVSAEIALGHRKSSSGERIRNGDLCTQFAGAAIEERDAKSESKRHARAKRDILDVLLASDCGPLRPHLMAFMLAGQDTVASAISFALVELASSPDVVCKMRAEFDSVCGRKRCGGIGAYLPTSTETNSLKFCAQVWQETLRLHPPTANGTMRRSTAQCTLPSSGLLLNAGVDILVPIYPIHRSKAHWGADADDFVPSRFDPAAIRARGSGGLLAYLPFSLGPRNCVGTFVASYLGVAILASLVRNFKVELACDRRHIVEYFVVGHALKPTASNSVLGGKSLPVTITPTSSSFGGNHGDLANKRR